MLKKAIKIDRNACMLCGGCVSVCPVEALVIRNKRLEYDKGKCTRCGICVRFCPVGALSLR